MAASTLSVREPAAARNSAPRHSALVRISHWVTTLCTFALILSGFEIVVSHPRFYWGETGNVMTPSLFDIPIPASRPWVNTGYGYVLPDQNGWSRNLHFEAAWLIIFTGVVYVIASLLNRHFRKNLAPSGAGLKWRWRPDESDAWSYNSVQRLAYLSVIFVLFPVAVWTGFAMSPALVSVFPLLVTLCGGLQSARTIHFFVSLLLVLFVVVHVVMVWRAGFRSRVGAMIFGRTAPRKGDL